MIHGLIHSVASTECKRRHICKEGEGSSSGKQDTTEKEIPQRQPNDITQHSIRTFIDSELVNKGDFSDGLLLVTTIVPCLAEIYDYCADQVDYWVTRESGFDWLM